MRAMSDPHGASPTPTAQELDQDEGIPSNRLASDVAALTDRGTRENNEDSYVVFRIGRFMERVDSNMPESELPSRIEDSGHLLIVADGVGGAAGGEVASQTALRTLLELVLRSPKWALKLDDPATREAEIDGLVARSRAYLQGMHARLRERQAQEPKLAGMGTTLTAAYALGGDLFIMHVGDSRAYVLRRDRLVRITREHTLAQHYADEGVLPQDQVADHPLSHVLTRAVGAPVDELEVDTHHREIVDCDRLLLCSDGLTKVATDSEIEQVLLANDSSREACAALVRLALERGGPDNVTVIVARYRIR
jgi:protein phosphatase